MGELKDPDQHFEKFIQEISALVESGTVRHLLTEPGFNARELTAEDQVIWQAIKDRTITREDLYIYVRSTRGVSPSRQLFAELVHHEAMTVLRPREIQKMVQRDFRQLKSEGGDPHLAFIDPDQITEEETELWNDFEGIHTLDDLNAFTPKLKAHLKTLEETTGTVEPGEKLIQDPHRAFAGMLSSLVQRKMFKLSSEK